jgi:hypothetical protein
LGSFGLTGFQLDVQPVHFEVFTSWVDRILDPHDTSHLIQFSEIHPENWMRCMFFELVKLRKCSHIVGSGLKLAYVSSANLSFGKFSFKILQLCSFHFFPKIS